MEEKGSGRYQAVFAKDRSGLQAALAHSSPAEASVGKATRSQPSAPTLQVCNILASPAFQLCRTATAGASEVRGSPSREAIEHADHPVAAFPKARLIEVAFQVQSVLNNARAVQQRSSGGPISQAVTPASINVPGLMASNDTPVVFQPELSSRATRVGRASTGGVHY